MIDTFESLQRAVKNEYTIEREVGRGGMSVVYLARDIRHDRRIALKILRPELTASIGGERFLREIRIEASLQHPHILPLYDSGKVDNTLYYTMPFVEGETLRQRLARYKQLPVDERLLQARLLLAWGDYEEAYNVAATFDSPGTVNVIYPLFLRQSLEVRLEAAREMGDESLERAVRGRLERLERGSR